MKTAATVIGLALALVTAPALAWNEPDSFRGVPWGTSAEDAEKILKERGDSPSCLNVAAQRFCVTRVKIGPVSTHVRYRFSDDRLAGVVLTFEPDDYPSMKRIFIERYGPPTDEKNEPFQTKGGLKATNQIVRWFGDKVMILLRAYADRIDQSGVIISLRDESLKALREQEKAIQKGKGDL